MARQQARRRHKERLAGIILAMLGVAVLVVAVIAISEPKDATKNTAADRSSGAGTATRVAPSSNASSKAPPKSTPRSGGTSGSRGGDDTSSSSAAKDVPLVVLNNTTVSGLAKTAADRFRNGGWTVNDTGNLQNDILSTCAYYDPSDAAAEKAARALRRQFPTIKRVQPKFPELPNGPLVVVLTPDYSAD